MRLLTHTVAAHEDGLTVKQLLRSLWHIDHSLLSRLKFRSAITLNGAPVTVRAVARAGIGKGAVEIQLRAPHLLAQQLSGHQSDAHGTGGVGAGGAYHNRADQVKNIHRISSMEKMNPLYPP